MFLISTNIWKYCSNIFDRHCFLLFQQILRNIVQILFTIWKNICPIFENICSKKKWLPLIFHCLLKINSHTKRAYSSFWQIGSVHVHYDYPTFGWLTDRYAVWPFHYLTVSLSDRFTVWPFHCLTALLSDWLSVWQCVARSFSISGLSACNAVWQS